MKTYAYLILLPCIAAGTPAFAQSAQSTTGLEQAADAGTDILVTANREARPASTVGQAVTVLDTATITQRQAVTVSDLLRQTPGVTVTRNGGVGTATSVNIRGAESDQTVALIDGIKLNDPSSPGGGFNFGSLLIGNIARIEVLRGAQAVLWGSQAIGGVVNLITRQPTEQLSVNARAEGGWHETGQAFANVSGKSGPVTRGRARIFSVYGQLAVTPIAGLTGTAGVRHDDHNIFGGATTFSGSGVYSPNGGATAFRASYSEGFKAPTLYQLQSEYGNTALDPERSHGWDAGVTQKALGGAVEASATYFRRNSSDLITFVSCTAPLTGVCTGKPNGTYDNIARARAQGVELSLLLRPVEALTFSAAYTYLDAKNRSTGTANFDRDLARRPDDSVTVNADYRWPFGLTTGATITAIGDSFDNASNARRLDGYVVTDVRASFPLGEHVEVYGRVENVFNERYQTIYQYGQPGRGAFGGIRLTY